MLKRLEMTDSDSCLGRAKDDELLFVLLSRDMAAPATIRFWVEERIRLGKNVRTDAQIQEALRCANSMEGIEPGIELVAETSAAPTERIWCMNCGKSVSTLVPKDTIVRAYVECPECLEKKVAQPDPREMANIREAANALAAENARLREALTAIERESRISASSFGQEIRNRMGDIARAALVPSGQPTAHIASEKT